MPNYDDDDDFDYTSEGSINEIRKADRAKAKRIKELEDRLSKFEAKERRDTLASVIKDKGLNPKIAAFVPTGITVDELPTWLDEYGDVFAPQGAPAQPVEGQPDQSPAPAAPEGTATFDAIAAGQAPTGDESELLALIKGASSKEELDRLIFGQAL